MRGLGAMLAVVVRVKLMMLLSLENLPKSRLFLFAMKKGD